MAGKNGVSNSTNFYVMDYLRTTFDNNSFDVVWALESACHSVNKAAFLKEMYRLLKKGGRFILADGFQGRIKTAQDVQLMRDFNNGFATSLISAEKFKLYMKEAGFKKIVSLNMRKEITPTSKIMYHLGLWGYPLARGLEGFRLLSPIMTKNSLACLEQYKAFRKGLVEYIVFYGEK